MHLLSQFERTTPLGRGAPDCIALVDCNNFYISCERKFDPRLNNRVVVVLSSNDGCVISRSEEAKSLGIAMGAPLFQCKKILEQHNAAIISANFMQYAQISGEIMQFLELAMPKVEVYSVDEAWLDISGMDRFVNREQKLQELRDRILYELGIPVSIGFSTTKVLAKIANKRAKKAKDTYLGSIMTVGELLDILPTVPVGDLWGIGRRLTRRLEIMGVYTAYDLAQMPEYMIREKLHLPGWHLWRELLGIPTRKVLETEPNPQSVLVSRSFGRDIVDPASIEAALITFVIKAIHKLWSHKRLASRITIFVHSNRHKKDVEQYQNAVSMNFDYPTDFPPTFIQAIKKLTMDALKPGIAYKKAGVCLTGLLPKSACSIPLYQAENYIKRERLLESILSLQKLENENPAKRYPLDWATALATRQYQEWQPLSQYMSNLSKHSDVLDAKNKRKSKLWW